MSDENPSHNGHTKRSVLSQTRLRKTKVSPQRLFSVASKMGGAVGWPVEDFVSERRLLLRNDAILPGTTRLEFLVKARADDPGSEITQTLAFFPRGRTGRIMWQLLKPVRSIVLEGMIRHIVRKAVKD